MDQKTRSEIKRANETIRRSREARGTNERTDEKAATEMTFDLANCANAFAKGGNKTAHLFDKLF